MLAERLISLQGTHIQGPLLITPRVFGDARGFFFENWNAGAFAQALEPDGQLVPGFVQDNHSCSSRGVLRGLHYQLPPHPQGKLVRCVVGEIFDVAVDLRRGSPSFDQWVGAVLSAANHQQLWVPAGFAYGFLTLTEQAEVLYKTQPRHDFEQGLSATVNWYLDHALWCQKACRFSGHGVVQASVPSSLS